ncbi:hypothetical protein DMN91_001201 [Ooceraea biroi]|uniref:Uncharacterized protein n=1 Tax=Ooceraea biroi TaxID=2015173 RepID=A0A3L8E412_OOCBI|nr:hypothetical protein DMN91_001201 [Ooceraea biroi]
MPKAVDRMNFQQKFYVSYGQTETSSSSTLELDVKRRRVKENSMQSDCSGQSFVASVILNYLHLDTEQQSNATVNDVHVSSVISLNEE